MAAIIDFVINEFKEHPIRTSLITGGVVGGTIGTLLFFSILPPIGIAAGLGITSAFAIPALNLALTTLIATLGSGIISWFASFAAKKLPNKSMAAIKSSEIESASKKNDDELVGQNTCWYQYHKKDDPQDKLTRGLVNLPDKSNPTVGKLKEAIYNKYEDKEGLRLRFFSTRERYSVDQSDNDNASYDYTGFNRVTTKLKK